jgi:hypothetical protein
VHPGERIARAIAAGKLRVAAGAPV